MLLKKDFSKSYNQSLSHIIELLQSSSKDFNLISRLAKYHIDTRADKPKEQQTFYTFCNKYFDKKIMCVRENIFEYAMSWSIRKKSGVLNVYKKEDREKVTNVKEVDEKYFIQKCKEYVDYHGWIEKNFTNIQIISYESVLMNSDKVLEQLTGYCDTFKNKFGINLDSIIKREYDVFNFITKRTPYHGVSKKEQKALYQYKVLGNDLIKQNIIHSLPIKNTTLLDKKKQIKNFSRCLDKFYNFSKNYNWIDQSKATYDFWNKKHIC